MFTVKDKAKMYSRVDQNWYILKKNVIVYALLLKATTMQNCSLLR